MQFFEELVTVSVQGHSEKQTLFRGGSSLNKQEEKNLLAKNKGNA